MAFVHGWKAFRVVVAHDDGRHLEDADGKHLHNAISAEVEPTYDGDEGHKLFENLQGAWSNKESMAYAHVTGLGSCVLHERGARCAQYSIDYFLEAWHIPALEDIAERLNVAILPGDEGGCPVCRGDATLADKMNWFGETYGRTTG